MSDESHVVDLEEDEYEEVPTPHVLICTPCYGGQTHANFTNSLLKLQQVCNARGIQLSWHYECNESLITRARNRMLTYFIENEQFTHLMWIDADLAFEPESFLALYDADLPVVAATYPMKRYFWQEKGEPAKDPSALLQYAYSIAGGTASIIDGRRIEALDVPTGFMLIQRDVINQMIEEYPETFVSDSVGDSGQRHYLLFDTMLDGDRFLSEDYAFCRRWQNMGGKVYLDLVASNLTHHGTIAFQGNLPTALRENGQFVDKKKRAPAKKKATSTKKKASTKKAA